MPTSLIHKIQHLKFLRKKWMWIGLILILVFGYWFFKSGSQKELSPVTVEKKTISSSVRVSGTVKPIRDASLGFEVSGKVSGIYHRVGNKIAAGSIIAELEHASLLADLREAQGNVEAQEAKLLELKRGSRPEDIEIKRAELSKSEQDLKNEYSEVSDVLNNAYAKTEDAVRKELDALFRNDEDSNPQLTFTISDSQLKTNVENQRYTVSGLLNDWQKELLALSISTPETTLDALLIKNRERLETVREFLNNVMTATTKNTSLSVTTAEEYKTSINTARTNVNTVIANINTQEQNVASQKLTVQRIKNELSLKLAGTSVEEIKAQEAVVKQAQAKADGIRANIQKTILRAPLTGTLTQLEIEVGEIVSPNKVIAMIVTENRLEIEAYIPEISITSIQLASPVSITLDASPGEVLQGKLVFIDPAETLRDGVVNFKVKIELSDEMQAKLRSGLTTNLTIETERKDNVLALPLSALAEREGKTFVQLLTAGGQKEVEVVTGFRGEDGFVEILSGLQVGDRVMPYQES